MAGQGESYVPQLFRAHILLQAQDGELRSPMNAYERQDNEIESQHGEYPIKEVFCPPQMGDTPYFLTHNDDVTRHHQCEQR